MRVARQFKRMDAVRRSPVYSQFGDAIQGACSIRAYDRVNSFVEQCDRLIDESQRPWFMLVAAQRWADPAEIMAWISNYSHEFTWDVITHPCPNFNEVRAGMSNYIPEIFVE